VQNFQLNTAEFRESEKMDELEISLKGFAFDWLDERRAEDTTSGRKTSVKVWLKRLITEFEVEGHELDRQEADYKQAAGQDADDYVHQKMKLIRKAHPDLDTKRCVQKLMDGVHPRYSFYMEAKMDAILRYQADGMIQYFTDGLKRSIKSHDRSRQAQEQDLLEFQADYPDDNTTSRSHAVDEISASVNAMMQISPVQFPTAVHPNMFMPFMYPVSQQPGFFMPMYQQQPAAPPHQPDPQSALVPVGSVNTPSSSPIQQQQ
jgi:hypothetical protein